MLGASCEQGLCVVVVVTLFVSSIVCPPVKPGHDKNDAKKDHPSVDDEEYGLEYERYLKEIFTVLEEDDTFKNKIMKDPEVKANDISKHLEFVSHNVRTKLDEIKRTEVERLRALIKLKMQHLKESGFKAEPGRGLHESLKHLLPESEHVDMSNPHSFEIHDLDRLIKKATADLDTLDKERKEEFKRYEMEKEHQRREAMKKLSPEERQKAEHEFEELKKQHKDHPKLHEPGSKAQLEEVWEEEDHMDKDSFDPKTFFNLHDMDGDGHLEPDEVEALVEREVEKAYEPGHKEDDLNEKFEEINRMREDIFKRYDKDHDGSISEEEFLAMSKTQDFNEDDGWKGLDEQEIYTPEELEEYEKHRLQEEQAQGHHEQPGVVHMDQGHQGQGQGHPAQGQPEAHAQPGHSAQGHAQPEGHAQPAHDQGHAQPAHDQGHAQPAHDQGHAQPAHDQGHVPAGQADQHVQPPIQSKPASEHHAPPQHPPQR